MSENTIYLSTKEKFAFSITKTKFEIVNKNNNSVYSCKYSINGEFELTLNGKVVLYSKFFKKEHPKKLIVYSGQDDDVICTIFKISNWFKRHLSYKGENYNFPSIIKPQIESLGIRFSRRGLCGLYRLGLVNYLTEITKPENYLLGLALTALHQGEISLSE